MLINNQSVQAKAKMKFFVKKENAGKGSHYTQ